MSYCPQTRVGSGNIAITQDNSVTPITFNSLMYQPYPSCGSVYGGKVDEDFVAADNMKLACYDGTFGQLCGLNNGVYCGKCSSSNMQVSLSSGTSYVGSKYFTFATDQHDSVSIKFESKGNNDIGFRAYAVQGTTPTPTSFTFYAPKAQLKHLKDDCAICNQYTYGYTQPCSKSVTLDISGIQPTDLWVVLLDTCEVSSPSNTNTKTIKPVNPYETTYVADPTAALDDYVVSVTISASLNTGAIVGIVIGSVAGAGLIGGSVFFGVKKYKGRTRK